MVRTIEESNRPGSPRVLGSAGELTHPRTSDFRHLTIVRPAGESHRQVSAGRVFHRFARTTELWLVVVTPLAMLLLLTLWFRWTSWDVEICRVFYGSANSSWPWRYSATCELLYQFGVLPGYLLAFCGLGVWLLGVFWDTSVAKQGLFCVLVVVLGPGALINGIFKPHWHRPRPNQIVQFGGTEHFVPVLNLGQPDMDDLYRSFPSGHASMGFCLIAPAFLLRRKRPAWARTILIIGLTAGLLLGTSRVVQGKHFPSDVLWSAGMVYFTAVLLFYSMGFYRQCQVKTVATDKGVALGAAEGRPSVSDHVPKYVSVGENQLSKAA